MPLSVHKWPGGGNACPSLAVKDCRNRSSDGSQTPGYQFDSNLQNNTEQEFRLWHSLPLPNSVFPGGAAWHGYSIFSIYEFCLLLTLLEWNQ
jgi:hypothetical protein